MEGEREEAKREKGELPGRMKRKSEKRGGKDSKRQKKGDEGKIKEWR